MGSYEIGDLLGAGGMGIVYRAHDTRLKRDVAIKVLSEEVTHDSERLARFEREARLLAALNHPHIAGIHGIDEAAGQRFLVMELVEGETLSDRIASGPIPLSEALGIVRQIAEGLEAAHEKGIVHRDLKPSNVQIARDGRVKILDFGLAKALDSDLSASAVDSLSRSPTISHHMTGVGFILGTAAYMSPEQVRGRAVDRRSDIWAFGVLLYEMLTGRRLFSGETVSDTLASVLKTDPDWSHLPPETPPTIRRLLARCLERDPKERLHDAGDARLEIDEAIAERRSGMSSQISRIGVLEPRRSWSRRSLVPLFIVVAVVGAGIGFLAGRRAAPVAKVANTPMRSVIPLPASLAGLAGWPSPVVALSRDGRSLAYVAVKQDDRTQHVWVRNMETGETRMVPDSETGEGPFFSPDGTWVAFAVDVSGSPRPGQLRKFSLATGLTQLVAPIPDYFGGDWGIDGTILFAAHSTKGPWLVPASGGQPNTAAETVIVGGRKEERALFWPQRMTGARTALFTDGNASAWGNAALLDLSTRELHDLQVVAPFARYAPTGHLLTLQPDGTLLATPFDVPTRKANGPSVAVLKGVAFSGNTAGVLALSDSGSLVYGTGYLRGSGRELRKLARVTFSGEVELLPFEADTFTTAARPSPDGRRIAASTWEGSQWVYDLPRGSRSRLPPGKTGRGAFIFWTPDAERLAFSTYYRGHSGESIVWQKADGSAEPEVLIAGGAEKSAMGFTPDGRTLIFRQLGSPDEEGLWMMPLAEKRTPRRLIGGRVTFASLSPDGRWIAYSSTDSGTSEIFAQSFPTPGGKVRVSVGESAGPEWSADGTSIVYHSAGSFFRVHVTAGDHLVVSAPEKLFERVPGLAASTIAPDGKGFLALSRPPEPDSGVVRELNLVTNWFDELERLAPSDKRK